MTAFKERETLAQNGLTHSCHCSLPIPPENIRKPGFGVILRVTERGQCHEICYKGFLLRIFSLNQQKHKSLKEIRKSFILFGIGLVKC